MSGRKSVVEVIQESFDVVDVVRSDLGGDRAAAEAIVQVLLDAGYPMTTEKPKGPYKMRDIEFQVVCIIGNPDTTGADTATRIIRMIDAEVSKSAESTTARICQWLKENGMTEAAEAAWAQFNSEDNEN